MMELQLEQDARGSDPTAALCQTLWQTWHAASPAIIKTGRSLGKSTSLSHDLPASGSIKRALIDLVAPQYAPGIDRVKLAGDVNRAIALAEWESVPDRVRTLYKEAAPVAEKVRKLIKYLPHAPGYGYVFWHPKDKALHAVLGDSDDSHHNRWSNTLRALPGVQNVTISAETHPRNQDEWVKIKTSGVLSHPLEWAGKLTGGASPLTNGLVGGLMGAGLGYAGGTVLENLFPEKWVERGRLRKVLAMAGGGLGAMPGAAQAITNSSAKAGPGQPTLGLNALWTPNQDVPLDPAVTAQRNNFHMGTEKKFNLDEAEAALTETLTPRMEAAIADFVKLSDYDNAGAGGAYLRPVPVDAFNQAVWNDVRKGVQQQNAFGTKSPWGDNTQNMHTPPQLGAATTGMLAGIQQMFQGMDSLTPRHLINGLATAGVDLATAHLVGGTLGALGGLTPQAQNTLQNMGVWGGLIRGTVGSMLRGR